MPRAQCSTQRDKWGGRERGQWEVRTATTEESSYLLPGFADEVLDPDPPRQYSPPIPIRFLPSEPTLLLSLPVLPACLPSTALPALVACPTHSPLLRAHLLRHDGVEAREQLAVGRAGHQQLDRCLHQCGHLVQAADLQQPHTRDSVKHRSCHEA